MEQDNLDGERRGLGQHITREDLEMMADLLLIQKEKERMLREAALSKEDLEMITDLLFIQQEIEQLRLEVAEKAAMLQEIAKKDQEIERLRKEAAEYLRINIERILSVAAAVVGIMGASGAAALLTMMLIDLATWEPHEFTTPTIPEETLSPTPTEKSLTTGQKNTLKRLEAAGEKLKDVNCYVPITERDNLFTGLEKDHERIESPAWTATPLNDCVRALYRGEWSLALNFGADWRCREETCTVGFQSIRNTSENIEEAIKKCQDIE